MFSSPFIPVQGQTQSGQDTLPPPGFSLQHVLIQGQFRHVGSPLVHIFGVWEETGVPGENPRRRGGHVNSTQTVVLAGMIFFSSALYWNGVERNNVRGFAVVERLWRSYRWLSRAISMLAVPSLQCQPPLPYLLPKPLASTSLSWLLKTSYMSLLPLSCLLLFSCHP